MQFFIFALLICFFVFLYCSYLLANDDYIFLRKDVTMEKIFNIIFLGSMISLFFARLFYGIPHASNILSNPFVFLLFPYFPGLSLLGGVVGVGVFFLFLGTRKRNFVPLKRLSDFFSLAFLISLPIGILGFFMFSEGGILAIKTGILVIVYLILFVIFLKFLLPRLLNSKLKEGTITFLFLFFYSIVNLISNAFPIVSLIDFIKNFENPILIIILIASSVLFIRNENLISKFRRNK